MASDRADAAVAHLALPAASQHVRIDAGIVGDALRIRFVSARDLPRKVSVREVVMHAESPRQLAIGTPDGIPHVRNTGRAGALVAVYRTIGGRTELVSEDSYTTMHRVTEYRDPQAAERSH